jgi:hypothetical protein
MAKRSRIRSAVLGAAVIVCTLVIGSSPVRADGNLQHVEHIIIVMQENRSFDNYFGVLAYMPGTPYHSAKGRRRRACVDSDHTCVDGLSCKMKRGTLACSNRNRSNTHGAVRSFHDPRYCTGLDLTHGWVASHQQGNFSHPNDVPMVTLAQEMKRLRELLMAATAEVGVERLPPLGAMIETPAAALCVVEIMTYADFLSIGTNDLTQYTMAAGREDPLVSDYFRDDHPAVLRLVRRRRCWRHTVGTVRRTRGTCERAPAPGCGGYPQPECGTTTRANRQGGGKTDAHSSQIR